MCGYTYRIRVKKRGRKRKRQSGNLAASILCTGASLRGLAKQRHCSKTKLTNRFHRSIRPWLTAHHPALPFTENDGGLVLVIDGIWFELNEQRYTVVILLVRRVRGWKARLRGLMLMAGDEHKELWEQVLKQSLTTQELANVRGLTGDGGHGLTTLCRERNWPYQRCHVHLIRDLYKIRGQRRSPTQWLRQQTLWLVRTTLNTPSERKANRLILQLRLLIAHPECPKTVRSKVGGFVRHYQKYRVCYQYPDLRLPKTTNSAECVSQLVQRYLNRMRGMWSAQSLRYWLTTILRCHPTIRCSSRHCTNQINGS